MGRRSISTTKSGKYMNPTDQARKQSRKKELKKNKRQRQMVRAAVLKGKDPIQIIAEMEKIDQMEYNVFEPPPLSEKVLKDKRKKLKQTFERVLTVYDKEDPEKWADLQRMKVEYEKRRIAMVMYAESVRHAQQVQVDDIPLPALSLAHNSHNPHMLMNMPSQIPLPTDIPVHLSNYSPTPVLGLSVPEIPTMPPPTAPPPLPLPPPTLHDVKRNNKYVKHFNHKKASGVPCTPPVELSDDETDSDQFSHGYGNSISKVQQEDMLRRQKVVRFSDSKHISIVTNTADTIQKNNNHVINTAHSQFMPAKIQASKPTTLQQKMLAMAGQDVDYFMKEMEDMLKKRKQQWLASRTGKLDNDQEGAEQQKEVGNQLPNNTADDTKHQAQHFSGTPATIPLLSSVTQLGLKPKMSALPHVAGIPPLLGIRLPPGPPPGRPLQPPGPPPGVPLHLLHTPQLANSHLLTHMSPASATLQTTSASVPSTPNILAAAPQLTKKPPAITIEAKPQIRNLSADVTRFLPTALRIKREEVKKKKIHFHKSLVTDSRMNSLTSKSIMTHGQPTKDDAYTQFMSEMEGLL